MSDLTFLVVVAACFGACLGSFANVVIYRMPKGESVVRPRSHCRSCGTPIRNIHNVPVLGWFLLRGKCAQCQTPFSIRYPVVELTMALLFAFATYKLGPSWWLLEVLIFIFGLVVVSMIDLDLMILPDKMTLPGIVIGLIGAAVNPERSFTDAILGVLFGGGFLWAIAYLYLVIRKREGMGGGDIKLLAWIGAVLGWQAVPFVIMVSSIIGSLVGIGIALSSFSNAQKQANETQQSIPQTVIPFGPYLSGAALLYILFSGQDWARWYLDLHGL